MKKFIFSCFFAITNYLTFCQIDKVEFTGSILLEKEALVYVNTSSGALLSAINFGLMHNDLRKYRWTHYNTNISAVYKNKFIVEFDTQGAVIDTILKVNDGMMVLDYYSDKNGKYLVSLCKENSTVVNSSIMVFDHYGKQELVYLDLGNYCSAHINEMSFSSDGKYIAFTRSHEVLMNDTKKGTISNEIFLLDLKTGSSKKILNGDHPQFIGQSPTLTYTVQNKGVFLHDIHNEKTELVYGVSFKNENIKQIRCTPDERYLVVSYYRSSLFGDVHSTYFETCIDLNTMQVVPHKYFYYLNQISYSWKK